ncbi:MAG: type II toxin-antitoxin system VapC family toxin [Candidatus Shapirobacteria bacterium]
MIDTDYLIGYLRGKKDVVEELDLFDINLWSTSVICVGEVLEGVVDKNKQKVEKWFEEMKIFEVDLRVARVFAEIRRELRKQGNLIDNMDLLIASTCLAYDLILVTSNKKHFERIGGLKIWEK